MPRHLIFPEEQLVPTTKTLDDYTLAGTKLLPENFGTIAPVNIFLGENNSGKSRFMREIMRSKDLRTISVVDYAEEFKSHVQVLEGLVDSTVPLISITMSVTLLPGARLNSDVTTIDIVKLLWGKALGDNLDNITIDIRDYIDKLRAVIQNLKVIGGNIENVVRMFSGTDANNIIEQLKALEIDFKRIEELFTEVSSTGILGKSFNCNSNSTEHGFRLHFAMLTFDRYAWPMEHHSQARNEFSRTASYHVKAIVLCIAEIRQAIEERVADVNTPAHRTYIPTLRTARTLVNNKLDRLAEDNDVFQFTTQQDYHLVNSGVVIDTGYGLYKAIDTTRNARHDGRASFKAFEQFLSDTFFSGRSVEVVAERVRDGRGGNIIVAVDGVERDIQHLGDGIQAIIMLLYPLFIAPQRAWFFIEEPETHLHPGFQRLFIETVISNDILRAKQLTIFLTTHSNHILDFAIDDANHVNIFTFRRREGKASKSTFQIQLTGPRDLDNLTALGVQNSSVFLANCSIWVEGITDRIYFRAYLQAYLNHRSTQHNTVSLLEGLHYTFLEYAGANITHYDFSPGESVITPQILSDIKALSIANRIMLIADADAGKQTRHEARANQQHSGFSYHVLATREVENLLSPSLITAGLNRLYPKLQAFDPNQIKQQEYRKNYIGTYLRQRYQALPTSFAPISGSGTIGSSYKRKFAEAAVKDILWEQLSPAAQNLTKEIFNFINDHNPRLGSN